MKHREFFDPKSLDTVVICHRLILHLYRGGDRVSDINADTSGVGGPPELNSKISQDGMPGSGMM